MAGNFSREGFLKRREKMDKKNELSAAFFTGTLILVLCAILLAGCRDNSKPVTYESVGQGKDAVSADGCVFSHAGFVVNDINKAMQIYQSIGFSQIIPPTERVWDNESYEVDGNPLSTERAVKFKEGYLRRGAFSLQFIQPIEGKNPHMDFLNNHGEGISYLCFSVDHLEKEQAKLVEKGFPVIQSVKNPDGGFLETYHDTRRIGNTIIALTQAPPVGTASEATPDEPWLFEKYDHIAFVVKDMEKAVEYFKAMGMEVVSEDTSVWGGDFMQYNGKALPQTPLKLYILLKGGVAIELFWVEEGENLWTDYLKEHGEGIHHLHFSVQDLDKETDLMVEKGFPVTFKITMPGPRLVESFFEPYGNVSIGLYRVKGIPERFKGLPDS